MRIHCVNVIEPRRPGARSRDVKLMLVVASSEYEAMCLVAAEEPDDVRLLHRNAFEPGETVRWITQSWTNDDVKKHENTAVPPRALAAYKYET